MQRTVSSLWIGPALSLIEQLCVRSFLDNGHAFELYAYGPIANVPDGAVILDANKILPEVCIYRTKVTGLAAFSDYFRWALLERKGGLWVDMDVVCLRPFDFPGDAVFGLEAPNSWVGTAVLGFPAGHFLAKTMLDACEDVNKIHPFDKPAGIAKKLFRKAVYGKVKSRPHVRYGEPGGPAYLTKHVEHLGLADNAAPHFWFYPIGSKDWRKFYEPRAAVGAALEKSYAIHLWNNILTGDKSVDKNATDLDGTVIGDLFARYLPQRPARVRA